MVTNKSIIDFCLNSLYRLHIKYIDQIKVSGITAGGGQSAPDTTHQEITADQPGKERQGNKEKWRRKEGKLKREGGKLKMEGGKVTK